MTKREKYLDFRNKVILSMNKFKVPYKLFGGGVVCIVDEERETSDNDISIKKDMGALRGFIDALVDCNYATREYLEEFLYSDYMDEEFPQYVNAKIETTNPDWKDFHIDLCFSIGGYEYDDMPSEVVEHMGIPINIVTFRHIIRMKANIQPRPRDHDIKDIQFLAKYLGLDPITGQPIEPQLTKSSIFKRN